MSVTLSIVVPAYNAELYLSACLDSILASTYREFEILLIDDGSTDKTAEICDLYSQNHPQIRVFHTENCGLPSARNLGIENAFGRYVGFVDADDLVSPKMFNTMMSSMKADVEMVACRFLRSTRDSISFSVTEIEQPVFHDQVGTAQAILYGVYGPYVWNKLYQKEILDKYQVRFRPDATGAEDQFFNAEYLQYCKKASFHAEKMYGYITTEGSITNTFRTSKTVSKGYVSLPRSWRFTADVMKDISKELEAWSQAKATMFYQTILRKLQQPDIEYVSEAVSYVQKNKNSLIRYSWGIKYYLSALVLCTSYPLWAKIFRRGY